jgi:hypothetical protein
LQRIATIGIFLLAAFLIGMFLYQVAYGTNESSYQYGYKAGREGYQCSNYDADCSNGLESCVVHIYYGTGYVKDANSSSYGVTNQTACDDGFVHGWKQWCNPDLALCAKFFLGNIFPGQLAEQVHNTTRVDRAFSCEFLL